MVRFCLLYLIDGFFGKWFLAGDASLAAKDWWVNSQRLFTRMWKYQLD